MGPIFQVVFLPFALAMDVWRWDIFKKDVVADQYNCHWWLLRYKFRRNLFHQIILTHAKLVFIRSMQGEIRRHQTTRSALRNGLRSRRKIPHTSQHSVHSVSTVFKFQCLFRKKNQKTKKNEFLVWHCFHLSKPSIIAGQIHGTAKIVENIVQYKITITC